MPLERDVQPQGEEMRTIAEIVHQAESQGGTAEAVRTWLDTQFRARNFVSVRPYAASFERDAAAPSGSMAVYLAADFVDGLTAQPRMLYFTSGESAAAPKLRSPVRRDSIRLPAGDAFTVLIWAFSPRDRETVRQYAEQVAPAFLPRPQRALPAIAAGNRHPEISLPAAFAAYRAILKETEENWASTVQLSATREMTTDPAIAARGGEDPTAVGHTRVSIQHLYHAGLWAAIRSGWRSGYTAEADHFIVSGSNEREVARSVETVKEAIREASGFTKFTTDTSRLFELESDTRHPQAWSASVVEERYRQLFTAEEGDWVLSEFSRPFRIGNATFTFDRDEVLRLAVKFGQSLKLNEELFDCIRAAKGGGEFDFEPSLDEAETLTTPKELLFYMHWLKSRGRPAQLVPPNLGFKKRQAYPAKLDTTPEHGVGLTEYSHHKMWPELVPSVIRDYQSNPLKELSARVGLLADVARFFNGTLSIHSGSGKQAEVLECIGRATRGRVNYKISGELQLELLDVLSEQPASSPWRRLFERMVHRANQFAATGAFGAESELAAHYVKMGREFYLGDAARGRVDGNLFLVFWLGNLVGSRDVQAPGADHRFFKEKLDELPEDLLAEVRKRNSRYIVWLVEHLRA